MFNKVNTASNKLQFFATEEGYATQDSNTADIKYTYQYKDHLGNVRLSYTDTNGNNVIAATEVIEESNYYPFGLQHKGYNKVVNTIGNSTAQKWKYNDTEYNESHLLNMYEMPLRSYDPALARWTTIDPVVHYSNSTYNGYDNNPVFWADPSGGDAYSNIMTLFNKARGGITTFVNDNWGGYDKVGHMSDEDANKLLGGEQDYESLAGGGGDGDPYKYKGKEYASKTELYIAILVDQAAEQFGIKDIVALAAAIDNQGLITKPFQMKGASKGTSIASKYGSKLLPGQMPLRLPTHFNQSGKLIFTKTLGRFLGRALGPIGWMLLAYDVGATMYNTQVIYNEITGNE